MSSETASSAARPAGERRPTPDLVDERRIARMFVSFAVLEQILSGHWDRAATNAPADLRVIDLDISAEGRVGGYLHVYIVSEELEPVPDGTIPPERIYTYKRGSS